MVRLLAITLVSLSLTAFSIFNIAYKTKQFYPATIYLTKNRICLTTIIFQCFVFYVLMVKMMSRIFFGTLQRTEVDTILSRYWFVFVDMCLVFASYQEQLSLSFLFSFGILLFTKGFHWLINERVDYMERTPVITRLFHFRCISLLFFLGYIDIYHIRTHCWKPTYVGETLHLAIGFEYFSMFFTLLHTYIRYALHSIDSRRTTPWDQKNMYFMLLDIVFGFLKFLLYADTMFTIWRMDHFPLFLVRPLYLSIRFLKKALKDYILSRRAIGFMNTVFKNATSEDLAGVSDPTCIICREEMTISEEQTSSHGVVKKLPCNHLFHSGCLRNWFQRQQTCPTCRMDVISQANRNNPASGAPNQPPANDQTNIPNPGQNRNGQQAQTVQPTAQPSNGQVPSSSTTQSSVPSTSEQFFASATSPPTTVYPPPSGFQFANMPQLIPGTFFPIIMPNFPQVSSLPPTLTQADIESSFLDEESLRASVEARMAALRQVQILVDAAMLQMNAYVSATAAMSSPSCPQDDIEKSSSPGSSPKIEDEKDSDEAQDAVRRRRLEKFNASSSSSPVEESNQS